MMAETIFHLLALFCYSAIQFYIQFTIYLIYQWAVVVVCAFPPTCTLLEEMSEYHHLGSRLYGSSTIEQVTLNALHAMYWAHMQPNRHTPMGRHNNGELELAQTFKKPFVARFQYFVQIFSCLFNELWTHVPRQPLYYLILLKVLKL